MLAFFLTPALSSIGIILRVAFGAGEGEIPIKY